MTTGIDTDKTCMSMIIYSPAPHWSGTDLKKIKPKRQILFIRCREQFCDYENTLKPKNQIAIY